MDINLTCNAMQPTGQKLCRKIYVFVWFRYNKLFGHLPLKPKPICPATCFPQSRHCQLPLHYRPPPLAAERHPNTVPPYTCYFNSLNASLAVNKTPIFFI